MMKPPFMILFYLIGVLLCFFMVFIFVGLFTYGSDADFLGIWRDPELRFALFFTLWTTCAATTTAFLLGMPAAYVLSRKEFVGKRIAETLVDIPIVLPPLVSGIALLIFFGPLFGDYLGNIGIEIVFSKTGVIVAQAFIALPFAIRAFKQAFDQVDPRYENIAEMLGYRKEQVFLKVTLPMAKGGILNGITMAWARTVGEFGATAMLAGITRMKTETLSIAIFLKMSIGDFDFAITISILLLLISLTLLYVSKRTKRWECG